MDCRLPPHRFQDLQNALREAEMCLARAKQLSAEVKMKHGGPRIESMYFLLKMEMSFQPSLCDRETQRLNLRKLKPSDAKPDVLWKNGEFFAFLC